MSKPAPIALLVILLTILANSILRWLHLDSPPASYVLAAAVLVWGVLLFVENRWHAPRDERDDQDDNDRNETKARK